ncbi:hypothetical protein BJX70DRAFT_21486 [Aspergillus crustosus]
MMESLQTHALSAEELLRSGEPFVPFSEFSVQTLQAQSDEETSVWIENHLFDGKPFVVRGFAQTVEWHKAALNNESLADLSAPGTIPVRNCQTGRDVRMRLRDLLSQRDEMRTDKLREFLYAKDLHCPREWVKSFETILPSSLWHLGSLDLFRVLPKETAPEVLMAYVGTRKSFSGFHRCFSATVAVNLLIESEGNGHGSICFGTDGNSQKKYDAFMEDLGKSPHTDWANVAIDKLKTADFPIYITDQRPGDLVIFPAATAHQIWNVSPMVTRVVWNILHATSVKLFFDYVEPAYQQQCHADTGRVPLIPGYAFQSLSCKRNEKRLLLDLLHRMVEDEETGQDSTLQIKTVDTQGAVVECNFCGLTIWNRHLHCEQCGDFDLCLTCFVSGRSCKHVADYTWVEMIPRAQCMEILQIVAGRIGVRLPQPAWSREQRSLGAVAVEAMSARQQSTDRLCHLCRDSHPAWKGIVCKECSAFFCYRGLNRHFDVDLIPFLRKGNTWSCPKCEQVCNCRCCHFQQPYQSKDKPARTRIKPIDPRGRILGFVDNVFDQKRGKRASLAASTASPQTDSFSRGVKRSRMSTDDLGIGKSQHGGSIPIASAEHSRTLRSSTPDHSTNTAVFDDNRTSQTPSRVFDPLGPFRIERHVESRNTQSSESRAPYSYPHPPSFPSPEHVATRNGAPESNNKDARDDEESICVLEKKLEALHGYADDLLELSLVDSHAKILERISQFEAEIEQRKRRKAEILLSKLNRDFPDIADLAREEARRRGYQ